MSLTNLVSCGFHRRAMRSNKAALSLYSCICYSLHCSGAPEVPCLAPLLETTTVARVAAEQALSTAASSTMGSKKLIAKLTTKLGRAPTADEVAKAKAKKEKKRAKAADEAAAPPSKKAKTSKKTGGKTDAIAWRKEHDVRVEPDDKSYAPQATWAEARSSVAEPLVKQCEGKGWERPTPVQAQCWPVFSQGRDVVSVAETGSGKTLAFGLPALSKFAADDKKSPRSAKQPAMLVLAPTRELACQSYEVLDEFCKIVGARCAVAYGGTPYVCSADIILIERQMKNCN